FIYKSAGAVLVYVESETAKKSSDVRLTTTKKQSTSINPKKDIIKKRIRIEGNPNVSVLKSTGGTDSISASTTSGKSIVVPVNNLVLKYIKQNIQYNIAVLICCILIVIDFYKKWYISLFFKGQLFQRPPPLKYL
ncbi:hypothetical protein AAH994_12100, partial [Weeksellaceae bacterium A-14]